MTVLYFFKFSSKIKAMIYSIIILISAMQGYLLNGAVDNNYIVFAAVAVASMYFSKELFITCRIIVNIMLISLYILSPQAVVGIQGGWPVFLNELALINCIIACLFFLTKWGNELVNEQRLKKPKQ